MCLTAATKLKRQTYFFRITMFSATQKLTGERFCIFIRLDLLFSSVSKICKQFGKLKNQEFLVQLNKIPQIDGVSPLNYFRNNIVLFYSEMPHIFPLMHSIQHHYLKLERPLRSEVMVIHQKCIKLKILGHFHREKRSLA